MSRTEDIGGAREHRVKALGLRVESAKLAK
jgi:hypothetical protein